MKASELIKELSATIEEFGDVECMVNTAGLDGENSLESVGHVWIAQLGKDYFIAKIES